MKIACIGYRSWALNIYDDLAKRSNHEFLIFRSHAEYNADILRQFNPDFALFYGWSLRVENEIIRFFKCLMLHPSPLPKYRGGSPIQNQIIAGETSSMVTIFQMTNEMDAGDIIKQASFSLKGRLSDIFNRIQSIGTELTLEILDSPFSKTVQKNEEATYCVRRTPQDSELTLYELQHSSAEYLYNKVRMLADPYPNAYIVTADGKKLFIKDVEIE